MKTMLFCTSYAGSEEAWDGRQQRWIDHHKPMCLGDPWLFDDGSSFIREQPGVSIVRFPDRLGRPSHLEYPGWWRSFKASLGAAEEHGYDRLIHIESDTFILSKKLRDFLATRSDGWIALWSRMYNFAETQVQVICKDQFEAFRKIVDTPYEELKGHHAEHLLPLTILKNFKGDRWPERGLEVPADADYVCAVPPHQEVWFR